MAIAYSAQAITAQPASAGSTLVVTLPTYAAGDFVVITLFGNELTATDTASATGWTEQGEAASGQRKGFLFTRKMDGTEGTTVTFTFNNAFGKYGAAAVAYTGVAGTEGTPATNMQNTTANWTCGPITTSGTDRWLVAGCFGEGQDFGALTAGTKRVDTLNGSESGMIADLAESSAGTYSMGGAMVSATAIHSVLIALVPIASSSSGGASAAADLLLLHS